MPISFPQVRVTINGMNVQGVTGIMVEQTGYYAADRFAIELAMGAAPLFDAGYYSELGLAEIIIEVANYQAGFVGLMTGQIDNIKIDFASNLVSLSGRDLSARLIDAEISETFVNQTSSQIAGTLAVRHGLTPNVTATSTPIGQYYELDHARSVLGLNSRSGSEWDLMVQLAQLENFSLSIVGETLNFLNQVLQQPTLLNVQDCMELSIDLATTLPTTTIVKSWNTRNKAALTQSAGAVSGGKTTLIKPNLTTEQAQLIASNHLMALTAHSGIMTAKIPGELELLPAARILLAGTESSLDQIYMTDSIVRRISVADGFTQMIRAHAVPG
ncbi:MAG: hypothetical protein P4L54_02350 [Acidocella sp.]|nr:hypothetical protein [Acidocella sp.]